MGELGDHRNVNGGGVIETGRQPLTLFLFFSLLIELIEYIVVGDRDKRIAMQQRLPL